MYLERVVLTNFRNYSKKTITFAPATLLSAPNGSGKSNLIEAIQLLSTGISERAGKLEEMIKWGCEVGSVVGVIRNSDESYTELTVVLTRGMVAGKKTPKRLYLIDGVARMRSGFVGHLVTMHFAPEDMRLIEGSRERRRKYMDYVLSVAHPDYVRALSTYEATLMRRNRLLDQIREGRAKRTELAYWDASLVKNGTILTNYRRDYLTYLSEMVSVPYGEYKVEYLGSVTSPSRLAQHLEAEIAVGYTLVGPHKDDFVISTQYTVHSTQEYVDLMTYGSRGEQRLGVLFLKIGAKSYLESVLKVKPLILLDDIFSELDEGHRTEILELQKQHQIVITTAEANLGIKPEGFVLTGVASVGSL